MEHLRRKEKSQTNTTASMQGCVVQGFGFRRKRPWSLQDQSAHVCLVFGHPYPHPPPLPPPSLPPQAAVALRPTANPWSALLQDLWPLAKAQKDLRRPPCGPKVVQAPAKFVRTCVNT